MDEQQPVSPESTPTAPAPQTTTSTSADPKHNTLMSVIAYIIFFVPLLTEAKNDPFVKFHVKQGLVLFLAFVASAIFMRLPIIGWVLMFPLNIFLFVLWIIGILNALSGKQKHLPVIGEFGDTFKF
jgi:uncharacterized membrane protein